MRSQPRPVRDSQSPLDPTSLGATTARRWHAGFLLLTWLTLLLGSSVQAGDKRSLAEQLTELSRAHDFELINADRAKDSPARTAPPSDSPRAQIEAILEGYAYVLLQPPGGKIRKLIVMGRKGDAPVMQNQTQVSGSVVPTEKVGDQHMVTALLFGESGEQIEVSLMVDTGASLIILPASLAPSLGLEPVNMLARTLQTANGRVQARVIRLPQVQIGEEKVPFIETAFVEDDKINGQALLGMNVLKRFRITLDNSEPSLTLEPHSDQDQDQPDQPR